MIKTTNYIRLHEVLSRALRHKKLKSVGLEDAILYAVDFMHAVGTPHMFLDAESILEMHNYRAQLPCDCVAVNLVMDMKTHKCMRAMTSTFIPTEEEEGFQKTIGHVIYAEELTFKILNSVLISNLKEGAVKISYKSIPVDEEGFPLILDNPTYLKALELYIKKEAFSDLYDDGELDPNILAHAELQYAFAVGQLCEEMNTPDVSEMESIARHWTSMLQSVTHFDRGFKDLGNREYQRLH